jgi:undecaprenyl-diphosphatase
VTPIPRRRGQGNRLSIEARLLVVAAAGVAVFVMLASRLADGGPLPFDEPLMLLLRSTEDPSAPIGPPWLAGVARDFTALGSIGVVSFVTLVVGGHLMLQGRFRVALFVLAAVAIGIVLSSMLKLGFDRARPDLVPHGTTVYSPAFPSGHALVSAVAYLTLAALLAQVQPRRRLTIYLLGTAAALTVAIGLTRVFLGVHWPSDVLAGWAAGVVWAALCWLAASRLDRRGRLQEPDGQPPRHASRPSSGSRGRSP